MRNHSDFFYFDHQNHLHISSLNINVLPGDSISILGVQGSDVNAVYNEFNVLDPISQHKSKRPVIRCITRNISLHTRFSAFDNFAMSDHSIMPYSRKQLQQQCDIIKQEFGIKIDFNIPLHDLSRSEQIIIELIHAYLSNMRILVCDNLLSLLLLSDRQILISIFHKMQEQGRSILYLTTKWESAVLVSQQIYVTSDRELLGTMKTSEVLENPQKLLYIISGRTLIEQNSGINDASNILDMLYAGAEYLTNNYELSDALSVVVNNIAQIIECESCCIYLYSNESNSIHKFCGDYSDCPELSRSFITSCLNTSSSTKVIYSNSSDINFDTLFVQKTKNINSFIIMPIISRAKILGVIVVFFSKSILYDKQQFDYIKSFCREAAIVIETSRLMGNSVLLQESNHRIKNNLQIIISLISMQQLYVMQHPECNVQHVLDSISNCVLNIASLHELLTSHSSGQSSIDLHRIISCVLKLYQSTDIHINVKSEKILIPYAKTTSLSMVINELVTNSCKYAFNDYQKTDEKCINIICYLSDNHIHIIVEDNGIGLPPNIDIKTSTTIGFTIIRAIVVNELHGNISIQNTGNGTNATIIFPFLLC